MNLVARRAELGAVEPHEGLQERAPVRRRSRIYDIIMHGADDGVVARHHFMQWRILDRKAAVAHRVGDIDDRVARDAAESGLGLGRVDLLFRRLLEPAVEEHGMVVAAGAPLRRLDAGRLLHVFDGLAIELIVERREVVHRAVPLLVGIFVAVTADLRIEEKARGDQAAGVGVGAGRKEGTVRATALVFHRGRSHRRVDDTVAFDRKPMQAQPTARRQQHTHRDCRAERPGPSPLHAKRPRQKQQRTDQPQRAMRDDHGHVRNRRADDAQHQPEGAAGGEHRKGQARIPAQPVHTLVRAEPQRGQESDAEANVNKDVRDVEDAGGRIGPDPAGVEEQQQKPGGEGSWSIHGWWRGRINRKAGRLM